MWLFHKHSCLSLCLLKKSYLQDWKLLGLINYFTIIDQTPIKKVSAKENPKMVSNLQGNSLMRN